METEHPLAFGDPELRPRTPKLEAAAGKILAILEPLEPAARARVLRAAAILLELDDAWIR